MNNIPNIITQDGISLVINGITHTVDDTHPNFSAIKGALRAKDWNNVTDLLNLTEQVKKFTAADPNIVIDEKASTIFYNGEEVHNTMVVRILDIMRDGFDVTPMTNLLANLYQNVSMKAIDELYSFMEYGKMPITEDGHFLAYKRVNNDYTSCYDGTTTNNIGEVTSLPRHKVDDRSEITCSYGLHICSFEYLKYYPGARVIVVKVNPKDVVSIPTDYNNTKARVCSYEVIGELTPEEAGLTNHSFGTSVYMESQDVWDGEEDQEDVDDVIEAIEALETMVNNISIRDVKDLLDLSANGQLTEDDLVQAYLKSKINQLNTQQKEPEELFGAMFGGPEPSDPEDAHLNQPQSTADALFKQQSTATVSDWFKFGYSNGYHDGKVRNQPASNCQLSDDENGDMTQQDIDDVNNGYDVGYKDGRGHKSRKYPKTNQPN